MNGACTAPSGRLKILVTGASGFIGGSFCHRFAKSQDVEIRGIGRRDSGLPGYSRADLTQPLRLGWQPDLVIHAAARAATWGSLEEFRRQNVLATTHVRDFCVEQGVGRLIYLSSSSVYYRHEDQLGLTEDSPVGPVFLSHYAQTKHEGEQVVRDFPGSWTILRPRAVFGPRDELLLPRLLRAAAQGHLARITRPGSPAVGDLIFIDTLCDYLMRVAINPEATGIFNLSNGEPVEIQEFIAGLCRRLGYDSGDRRVSRSTAMRLATSVEGFYRLFLPRREPPLTTFGVSVLSYSKTLDVSRCLQVLGPPSVSMTEGLNRLIEWQLRSPEELKA